MPFPFLQSPLALLASSTVWAPNLSIEIAEFYISSKDIGEIVVG
jgi:hypothetical protein